ncbi:hypothetical protein WJX74_005106 [Apatococcus lobatus]|uniref:MI domain-containing protein n=1 Tax=Apatococcus lobatus TaxID=904363 RepID=A0AAW1RLU9_9CHLO
MTITEVAGPPSHSSPSIDLEASTASFLSAEQRAILDSTLEEKRKSSGEIERSNSRSLGTSPTKASRSSREIQRKLRQGRTKKHGAGGKFTWGTYNSDDVIPPEDPADPNYISDDNEQLKNGRSPTSRASQALQHKHAIALLIAEYFDSGDMNEAAEALEDLKAPGQVPYFVKRVISIALDRHDREREMASCLLSGLYNEGVRPVQMQKGFQTLIAALDDLCLDVPEAPDLLALFTARAVVDDILPPCFPSQHSPSAADSKHAGQMLAKCQALLKDRHSAERLLRCWGGHAGLDLKATQASIIQLLQEYTASQDSTEAAECLRKLAVPFFHHEVVKQSLLIAITSPQHQAAMLHLLSSLSASGQISSSQLSRGVHRVVANLDDTCLDCPDAKQRFAWLSAAAAKQGMADAFSCPSADTTTKDDSSVALKPFKLAARACILEYFESDDLADLLAFSRERTEPGMQHILVKQLIQLAMDRRAREREQASLAVSALAAAGLQESQLTIAFEELLLGLEDLELDVPDAEALLALFLARSLVDEALPPSALNALARSLPSGCSALNVVQLTGAKLGARHAAERVQQCWKGSSRDPAELKADMRALLKEYAQSNDRVEALHCLRDLGVPAFHHELVRQALMFIFQEPAAKPKMMNLLKAVADSGIVPQNQMQAAFARVKLEIEDIQLDCPGASEQFAACEEEAASQGWIA